MAVNSVRSKIHVALIDRTLGQVPNLKKMTYLVRVTSHKEILQPIVDKLAVRDAVDAALYSEEITPQNT